MNENCNSLFAIYDRLYQYRKFFALSNNSLWTWIGRNLQRLLTVTILESFDIWIDDNNIPKKFTNSLNDGSIWYCPWQLRVVKFSLIGNKVLWWRLANWRLNWSRCEDQLLMNNIRRDENLVWTIETIDRKRNLRNLELRPSW